MEKVQLVDFIAECVEVYGLDENDYKPKNYTGYKCSKCGREYNKKDKFCSVDGEPVIEYNYKRMDDDIKSNIFRLIADFEYKCENDEKFSYKYIKMVEKRGDGSGYHMHFIFKRKLDNKYFFYYSYDGRIEETILEETSKVVTTVWNFEKHFD